MRSTITMDGDVDDLDDLDDLDEGDQAMALAAPGVEKSELIRPCARAFVQRQTARRLAALIQPANGD